MTDTTILKCENIVKTFPGVKALDGVNLTIYENEAMALMGENGAGKSTLIKILSGVHQADSGKIYLDGQEVHIANVTDAALLNIAVIHQELNLIPSLSVSENIFLGRELQNGVFLNKTEMQKQSRAILERLGLSIDPKQAVGKLSIANQQMVEIARALLEDARIIIMDEPTDALTDKEVQVLFSVIRQLKAQGKSIVYISHRLEEIFEVCERATILRDGTFIAEEKVSDLDQNKIIKLMVGREITEQFPYHPGNPAKSILQVEGLTNDFVSDISFELKSGEVLGVAGLVGSGRTELAKTIYGFYTIHSGTLNLGGKKLDLKSTADGIKHGITYVSEDRKKDGLILPMNVTENITISALKQVSGKFGISKDKERKVSNDFVERMRIKTPSLNQKLKNLSGGNQQKVSIARGLMNETRVLILDEPTRGVDVGAKKEIYDIVNDLKAQGVGVLLISSDMPELLGMSDRILVMHEGRLKGELTHNEATQERIMSLILA
ncbi:sugar ABC transporter ATP-binding protein [Peptoniphilus equinus]|uniref:Sugar ABC transporter ATP-binding protein n=1 Tax=Peptoniphilus equinus TaxID=3016343 RepID=A0ABY7QV87_9FIRM|nr:sugar ABC transporter ATP-binding protein [Peptoniphilus equinus]WBW50707.1 sugar ABC transporter ATP-binding protein [Peptoniphilus equinus]